MSEQGIQTPPRSPRDETLVFRSVRSHLRANGDWNINDWRDVARILADQVEELLREVGRGS